MKNLNELMPATVVTALDAHTVFWLRQGGHVRFDGAVPRCDGHRQGVVTTNFAIGPFSPLVIGVDHRCTFGRNHKIDYLYIQRLLESQYGNTIVVPPAIAD